MSNVIEALFETVPDPLWIVTREHAIGRGNRAFSLLCRSGFDPLAAWWRDVAAQVLAGRSVRVEANIVLDGVERTFAVTATPADEGAVFLARAVTDFSRVERKGQEWSMTFDAIELPVFITLMDGTIVRLNRAARDLVGEPFAAILGRNIRMHEREPWITLGDIVTAVRDSRTPCSAEIGIADEHWDVTATWYRSAADDEERAIVVMRETTDIIRLQESVRRGEQMAALGELVAGVAHEVRNPVFGMGLTVNAMDDLLPPNAEVMELFRVLRMWLERLNRLMENLLQYGKPWTLDLREGTIDSVLAGVIERCRQIATPSSIAVDAEIEPGLPMLMEPNRLSHAFENLINNAIQHSHPDQSVLVSARAVDASTIECVVRDHGAGFDPADLPRVFQPFFTRRPGGTGLGLSIVQRIVDEHGGTIAAGNADGGGAVLTMRFPIYRGAAANGADAL